MPTFDAAWTEKLEIFELPTRIFLFIFDNLSKTGGEIKAANQNKRKKGVTYHLIM